MTIPVRRWPNAVLSLPTQIEVSETTPGDNIIELAVTAPAQSLAVYLDPSDARDLIAEIHARLAVIDPAGEL